MSTQYSVLSTESSDERHEPFVPPFSREAQPSAMQVCTTIRTIQERDMKCRLAGSRRRVRRQSETTMAQTRHGTNCKQHKRHPRSGFTLVEMLVVISVAAVMLGLSVSTIHLLLDAEHEAARSLRFNTSVARLAQAFRGDMHASRQVELPASEAGQPIVLVASADGRQFRYELDAHLATRIETEAGKEVHREVYYFPPHSSLRFEHRSDQKGPDQKLVLLEIEMAAGGRGSRAVPSAASDGPKRRYAIEAALGRDHRFERRN